MLLSCIGQRSLSNSGVLEGLLNLLDNLLSPLQQPQAAAQRRTEGKATFTMAGLQQCIVNCKDLLSVDMNCRSHKTILIFSEAEMTHYT